MKLWPLFFSCFAMEILNAAPSKKPREVAFSIHPLNKNIVVIRDEDETEKHIFDIRQKFKERGGGETGSKDELGFIEPQEKHVFEGKCAYWAFSHFNGVKNKQYPKEICFFDFYGTRRKTPPIKEALSLPSLEKITATNSHIRLIQYIQAPNKKISLHLMATERFHVEKTIENKNGTIDMGRLKGIFLGEYAILILPKLLMHKKGTLKYLRLISTVDLSTLLQPFQTFAQGNINIQKIMFFGTAVAIAFKIGLMHSHKNLLYELDCGGHLDGSSIGSENIFIGNTHALIIKENVAKILPLLKLGDKKHVDYLELVLSKNDLGDIASQHPISLDIRTVNALQIPNQPDDVLDFILNKIRG